MNSHVRTVRPVRRRLLPLASLLLLALGGCLSSAPPAPPVRWFDPLAPLDDVAAVEPVVARARVAPSAFLDQQIALRVGPRELLFDVDHRWLRPPHVLVAEALRGAGVGDAGAGGVTVRVAAFELDLREQPLARVRLEVGDGRGDVTDVVQATAAAREGTVEALVAALGDALRQAARDVRRRLTAP